MPTVTFQPAGVTVEVEPGTSLLDAARQADLPIRNDCGGQGVCGHCIIQVQRGEVERLKSRHGPPAGSDLACRTLVREAPVTAFLPEESHEVDLELSLRPCKPLAEDAPAAGALVETVRLDVPPPSLDDNVCDADRLTRALRSCRSAAYVFEWAVLPGLAAALRQAEWQPEVTLAAGTDARRVIRIGEPTDKRCCLLAVDIGTTAIKARLIAPAAATTASCYNTQVMYGPDVISRIMHCERSEGECCPRLQQIVVADVQRLAESLIGQAGLDLGGIWGVVVAGNTTMVHLFLGLDPRWIRRDPYVGLAYGPPPVPAEQLGLRLNRAATVYAMPSVSGFVGADIVAGVLATGLADADEPRALIDLGTNGEIVVGCRDFLVCCSASAGPAFEGGASASGTRARAGAIDTVWVDDAVRWRTIADAPPVGICGTGYIDLLATLSRVGVVDKTGRFAEDAPNVRCVINGNCDYLLVRAADSASGREIVLTQADVDNLIRAKAAIFAAARVLLGSLGMEWSDLAGIMLAGGFGESLDKDNAVAIGLLPDVPRERIEFVGNTSLRGAVIAAQSEQKYRAAFDIARRMTYLELSTHPDFMDEFVSARFLPHTDTEKFPSVTAGA